MGNENYYQQLVSADVVSWVSELLDKHNYRWRFEDGKIIAQLETGISSTPWHHVQHDHRLNCALWHQIMFSMVAPKTGKLFVPSKCQNCFKVVVRPKTLAQLFALMELQKRLGRPCKCGIEVRESVPALYGGYFYNWGIEEGLQCYELVRQAVDADPRLGPDIKVLLKRACTEYEHACGPSDKWVVTPEQLHVEAIVERWVLIENKEIRQPEKLIHRVHRRWIEFAYEHGDETYQQYTGGLPLYPPYKTYQHWLPTYKAAGEIRIEGE